MTSASPFRIEGPAVISFSGGRTSAYMLRRILDEGLQPDVHVLFANTGKERPETLDFVHECQTRWGVPVRWLERHHGQGDVPSFTEVTYATASRQGEPFAALLRERGFPPNPIMRFCTTELKVRVMKTFMLAQGYEHWTNVVGLRADEPGRVANGRATEGKERWDLAYPLFDAGIRKDDVILWWKKQPHDLQLRSWEGNCDLCFLKGQSKRLRIMEDRPDLAEWWIARERDLGASFRVDTPTYAALLHQAQYQGRFFSNDLFNEQLPDDPTDLGDCVCLEAA
ncbi:phosphoadenosine phosphosulfate reductase family protein [Corallococcus sp. EGB]|uniref:phosphoadenosine phosphosulfate reductase domain-containing protein n=1 Tax=Corallococcus sp. EGB TaxID=1521117 RepID=UPI001CBD0A42|nr:phosphoadenosine phosphosulfate reductase family protein [Corallococcus sp. EGB]